MELDGFRFDLLLDEVPAPGGVYKLLDKQFLEVEVGGHVPEDVRTTEDDLQPLHLFRSPVDDGGATGVGKNLHRGVSYDQLVERALFETFEARPDDAELPRLVQKRVLEQRVCRRIVFRRQQSTPNVVSQLQVVPAPVRSQIRSFTQDDTTDERQGRIGSESVRLSSQNEAPLWECEVCGEDASWICTFSTYAGVRPLSGSCSAVLPLPQGIT